MVDVPLIKPVITVILNHHDLAGLRECISHPWLVTISKDYLKQNKTFMKVVFKI